MTQLTKEFFAEQLKKLATKKDIQGLATQKTLDKVTATLDRTTALVANLAEDFGDFSDEMKNIPSILDSHTTTLDAIFKNTEHWKTEATSLQAAIKRHEDWIAQIAERVGIRLEGLER